MHNFRILLRKNLVEMIRNKKIIIFGVVFIVLSLISSLSARYLPELLGSLLDEMEETFGSQLFVVASTVADSYVQFISNFSEVALLLVGIMFASTITKEKNKGTYTSLKMHGVKDKEIVFSHLVSQIILISVSYIVSVPVFVLLNTLLFRQIMGIRGLVVLFYIYLLLIFMVCFAMFVSCLCKKNSRAYLLVILGYFAFGILEVLPKLNKFNPFHLITISSNLMYYKDYSLSEHLITSLFAVVLSVVLIVVSLLLVKNRINNKKDISCDNTERV